MATPKNTLYRNSFDTEQSIDIPGDGMDQRMPASPVAVRKQHYENIFKKPALPLTSPSQFKHYEPGSLVKQRHSWLQEVIGTKQESSFLEQNQHTLTERDAPTRDHSTEERTDEDNEDYEEDTRDIVSESPRKGFATSLALPSLQACQEQEQRGEANEGAGENLHLDIEQLDLRHQELQHLHESVQAANIRTPPSRDAVISSFSRSGDSGETRDDALTMSDVHTDKPADKETAIAEQRRWARKKHIRGSTRRSKLRTRSIRRVESEDQKIAVEDLVPTFSAEVAELHKQHVLTMAPSELNDDDEWRVVRVNSQTCETRCLDAMPCSIL